MTDPYDLDAIFSEIDSNLTEKEDVKILHAPFGYPGGKSRSVHQILEMLPYDRAYIEPFGGSGAVLLSRKPSRIDVYNDRFGGVVDFYRCLQNFDLMNQLAEKCKITINAKEFFHEARDTWNSHESIVDRAYWWLYVMQMSFASQGRNWGRITQTIGSLAGKIYNIPPDFLALHERLKRVQIENADWQQIVDDYDAPDAVFYMDPPYFNTSQKYKHRFTPTRARELGERIFKMRAFVALSGYEDPIYDNLDWDDKITWESFVSTQGLTCTESNRQAGKEGLIERAWAKEVLWIKEAR